MPRNITNSKLRQDRQAFRRAAFGGDTSKAAALRTSRPVATARIESRTAVRQAKAARKAGTATKADVKEMKRREKTTVQAAKVRRKAERKNKSVSSIVKGRMA